MDPNKNEPQAYSQPTWQQQPAPPTGYPQPTNNPGPVPPVSSPGGPIITKPSVDDPDQSLGIASLVLAFTFTPVGLILGIIALRKSKAAGYKNTFALLGTIISGVIMALAVLMIALIIPFAIRGIQELDRKCKELGPGTHQVGSATYECPASGRGGSVQIKE